MSAEQRTPRARPARDALLFRAHGMSFQAFDILLLSTRTLAHKFRMPPGGAVAFAGDFGGASVNSADQPTFHSRWS